MLPVIAIVGRPNVGKSTLFNRLTRTRDAITSSFPGTTRDRLYGEVDWDNRHFILIDTGGITAKPDEIGKLICHQAWQAIDEADQILFVLDGQSGISDEDLIIAKQLRQKAKPLWVVINKTENKDRVHACLDAYELGLGEPIPIAAVHGTGVSDLVLKLFPEPIPIAQEIENVPNKTLRLAIVGRPNVGKSTLTNRILGEERVIVSAMPGTTRSSTFIPLERRGKQYILIDTAGVRRRKNITEEPEKFSVVKTLQAIEHAHVILFIIDAREGVSEQDLKLLGFILNCGKALVIALNKWDGMSASEHERAKASLDRQLTFVKFAKIHFISALHGTGVGNLFESIDEAYACATTALATPVLTRLLQQAVLRHSPPLVKGRRIKLRYAHPGGINPPRIIIHGNQVDALPESYRKFLAHFFQKKLNLHGTPLHLQFKSSDNPFKRT